MILSFSIISRFGTASVGARRHDAPRRRFIIGSLATVVALIALAARAPICMAHPAQLVAAVVRIDSTGHFRVNATFDALAFALNDTPAAIDDASMNQLLDGPRSMLERRLRESRERFEHGFSVLCGDSSTAVNTITVRGSVTRFPSTADVQRWCASRGRMRLPVIQEVAAEGKLPASARSIAFRFPEVMGPLILSVERPGLEPYSEPVEAGQVSSVLSLPPLGKPVVSTSDSGAPPSASAKPAGAPLAAPASSDPGQLRTAIKYLSLGFHHILPAGPDHILFVLGLFLLSTQLRPLLWQVTAFTLAHSLSLGLAMYGVIRPPPMIVEPLIALSIAFVAVENLFTTDLKPWRPAVVFGFGLVHGMGFAGVLTSTGLSRAQFAPALVTFNIGVELGQLAVIALAFAAVGWWQRRGWYRRAIVLPTSTAIAVIAVFWTIQRVCAVG